MQNYWIIIPNLRGNNTTPSVVSVNRAGEVIVGEDAKQNLWLAPEDTVSEIKREMGRDFKVTMKGQRYNPQTISAFILRYLKRCAEEYLGEPVHDAVITVPTYFTEVQMNATREAGRIAGLEVHGLIDEATAAAIAYGVSKAEEGEARIYMVYNLGGGHLDVSIIKVTEGSIAVVAKGSDPLVGGLDMDDAVVKWVLWKIKKEYGVDLSSDEAAKRRLKLEAEGVKKALVIAESAALNIPVLTLTDGKPLNVAFQISRAQFEMWITPLVSRSLRCVEETVSMAEEHSHVEWDDLDGVLMVGGPTRLRKIRDELKDLLRKRCSRKGPEIRRDLHPDEVVAMGAAIVAAGPTPRALPTAEVPHLAPEQVPVEWRHYWVASQALLSSLEASKRGSLLKVMTEFASAVLRGNKVEVEDKAFLLEAALLKGSGLA